MKGMREEHDELVNCSELLRSSSKLNQCNYLVFDAVDAIFNAFSPN